ncbi:MULTISPECIES: hypothetical protein [Glycomyces]|uniref:Helix-turn-helix domain-containing protein n=2 Tax=Glycomyces TaxID=58113 RepID=A0ABU2AHU9_9ACTN|nr:hypothetical protein [Glycomyces lechevalierae]MDR7336787.1 hypothetical protein [Glycomyces lechevalierae]
MSAPIKHGSLAGSKVHRCKCALCRETARIYDANRRRLVAYGRWHTLIDAEPVRHHVQALQAEGLGWMRIARLAGLSTSTVWKLLYGDPHRGLGPSKRVKTSTAEKLFTVRADLQSLAGATTVNAIGTRRRLQALVAIGWSQNSLAEQLGMLRANFGRMMRSERVMVRTAKAVRALYDERWNQAPPQSTPRERFSVTYALKYAEDKGWVPPMAWDDDTIDDPAATPVGVGPAKPGNAVLPDNDDLQWLLDMGETVPAIAMRFNAEEKSVRTRIHRLNARRRAAA